ncbi:MAG: hypothetical protein ACRDUV_22605 [Pseudonocardiaceae bacterium]
MSRLSGAIDVYDTYLSAWKLACKGHYRLRQRLPPRLAQGAVTYQRLVALPEGEQ